MTEHDQTGYTFKNGYQKACEDILKTLEELGDPYDGRWGNDTFSWGINHGITMSKRAVKEIIESEKAKE